MKFKHDSIGLESSKQMFLLLPKDTLHLGNSQGTAQH